MIKKILFIYFIFIQTPNIVTIKELYQGKGVIFNESYKFPFKGTNYKEPVTPNLNQIIRSENILYKDYYKYRKSVLDSFRSNYKINSKYLKSKNVQKKFSKFNRQYAGYTNQIGDTIIYIGLFNFNNLKKAENYFENWDTILFLGSGGFYEGNQEFYEINLNQNKIEFN
ncbi:hypothetical protein [Flavobacterium caeni]|uniref:Uncharacterized protein n=1 Tax=Flavobacterium caeni TaxID=490189 RepID=A0A1G5KKG6_9FLAO|nr:hypothetical protein [Flavobacterium caeni]SCZ01107.1 hypothetical protein SAMN02927903_03354 [Flavobacterium caeni]